MGWDAYAVTSFEALHTGEDNANPVFRAVFTKASAELARRTGRGGQIWDATLGGSSLPFLQCAAPLTCFDRDNEESCLFWSTKDVSEAYRKADWDFTREGRFRSICDALYENSLSDDVFDAYYDADNFPGEKWEVRLFLEACTENHFAIAFTW